MQYWPSDSCKWSETIKSSSECLLLIVFVVALVMVLVSAVVGGSILLWKKLSAFNRKLLGSWARGGGRWEVEGLEDERKGIHLATPTTRYGVLPLLLSHPLMFIVLYVHWNLFGTLRKNVVPQLYFNFIFMFFF